MADSPWQTLTLPFRTAAASLLGKTVELRELGGDDAFWRLLIPLDSLPEAARFQPLEGVRQWQIGLTQQTPQAQPREAGDRAFIERMQRRAIQRDKLALVEQTQAKDKRVDEGRQASPANEPRVTITVAQDQRAQRSTDNRPAASPSGAGVWTVIEQIATLTRQLQPSARAQPNQAGQANPQSRHSPGKTTEAPAERQRRRTTSTRAAAMTIESVEHRSAPSVGLNPGSGNLRQNPIDPSLGLLAEYISQLWPTRDASEHKANQSQSAQQSSRPAASQPAAEPAPRAPSLLQASDNFPARETTEVGIRSNGNQQPQLGRDAPVRAVAEQARANAQRPADEELEARLNRALIEQAWLRGVDLT